jgi:UDP-N-acetylmuramate: L-alanyl-gamma-D-glutamyl-meso-diaminopimelate ligase
LGAALAALGNTADAYDDLNELVQAVVAKAQMGDHVLCMSNGSFGGVHEKLLAALRVKFSSAS